jgi:hypothetical protein
MIPSAITGRRNGLAATRLPQGQGHRPVITLTPAGGAILAAVLTADLLIAYGILRAAAWAAGRLTAAWRARRHAGRLKARPDDLMAIADTLTAPGQLAGTDQLRAGLLAAIAPGLAPQAAPNGRRLANTLRRDTPWATDTQLAVIILTTLDWLATCPAAADGDDGQAWRIATDALGMAVVELTELDRSIHP